MCVMFLYVIGLLVGMFNDFEVVVKYGLICVCVGIVLLGLWWLWLL